MNKLRQTHRSAWRVSYVRLFCQTAAPLAFAIVSSMPAMAAYSGNNIRITYRIKADIPVKGKITDKANGDALPGVSVKVKGSSAGAVTDANGNFSLNAPENGTLVISYIGYTTMEVPVNNRNTLRIALENPATALGEVVVVGYGTTSKKDITGSVVSIKTKDLPQVANTSINNLLQGQAAGLNLSVRSAQPGGGLSVNIRGAISPRGSNAPLYVIDGVPILNNASPVPSIADGDLGFYGGVDQDPLSSINPSDIESVDVLKDASATAIYGSAAANGVILITTKKAKAGQAITEYRGSYTIQSPKPYLDFLDAGNFMQQQVRLARDKYLYDNNLAPYGNTDPSSVPAFNPMFSDADISKAGAGTDWLDLLMRQGSINEHNISVSGGTEKTKVYASFNLYDNKALLENSRYKRYTGRVNLEQQISSRVKFNLNLTLSQVNSDNAATGSNAGGPEKYNQLQAAYTFAPNIGIYDESGNYTKSYDRLITNPAAFSIIRNQTSLKRLLAAPTLEIKILDNLKLTAVAGIDKQSSDLKFYLPRKAQNAQLPEGMAQLATNNIGNYTAESYLTFNKSFKKSDLAVVAGAGYYKSMSDNFGLQAVGFFTDAFSFNNVGVASNKEKSFQNSFRAPDRIKVSQFFRVNYSYDNKYILTLTGRNDGSSYFADNHKFGFFPGLSAAWRISEEPFLKNPGFISNLKLRAGYGTSGNESILGTNALSLYGTGSPFLIGSTYYTGIAITQIANPDLTWETDKTINLGLDFGFFNDRLTGALDVFRKEAKDLLDYNPLPSNNAVSQVAANVGSTRSDGIELSLNSRNTTGAFKWNTSFNISQYKNYWIERNPVIALSPFIGAKDPIREIYGWKTDGIIKSAADAPVYMPNARPGNIRYTDVNNDGNLDINDVVKLGNRDPKFSIGLGNTFSYKNFDLNVFVYGNFGGYLFNSYSGFYDPAQINGSNAHNTLTGIKGVWSADNTNGIYPGYASNPYSGNNPTTTNDFYLQKVNFLRLRNITLGYKLPDNLTRSTRLIRNARLFFDMQNIAVLTNYKGYDPEVTEVNPYPQALSATFGVNLTF